MTDRQTDKEKIAKRVPELLAPTEELPTQVKNPETKNLWVYIYTYKEDRRTTFPE